MGNGKQVTFFCVGVMIRTWRRFLLVSMSKNNQIHFLTLKGKGCNWQYVRLPFCWSWPEGWDILQKRGGSRKQGQWLQNRGYKQLFTLVLEFENFMQSLSAFYCFFGDKKIAFKSSLDLTFISSLLNFFHLPIYS